MKNVNTIGEAPEIKAEKTGWENLEKIADQMNKPKFEREDRETLSLKNIQKEESVINMRDKLTHLAKPAESYRASSAVSPKAEKAYEEKNYKEKEEYWRKIIHEAAIKEPEQKVRDCVVGESVQLDQLLKKKEMLMGQNGLSGKELKQHNKKLDDIEEELRRYGWSEVGSKSRSYNILKGAHEASGVYYGTTLTNIGRQRFEDCNMLKWYLEGGGARGKETRTVKKALKKAGFKKMPENYNDKNFTSYELSQMVETAKIARNAAEKQRG